jgi:spermidine synthase
LQYWFERNKKAAVWLLWISFFISGACGLVYEVTWTRMLTLTFGASVFAMSAVLTAYMGGLALGSYLFGRYADRSKNPARIYAFLEIGIGAYAFVLPAILRQIEALYVTLFSGGEPSFYALSLMRFVMAVSALIVPTTLMGATLPMLSKFVGVRLKNLGWSTGSLYALNTLGAVVGCAAAGFLLIGALGIERTIGLAVAANFLVGSVVYLALGRHSETGLESSETIEQRIDFEHAGEQCNYPNGVTKLVLVFFGVSGFCSLAYEVLWTRALVFHMNISIYAFTTMLTTFLVGLALGSFVCARVSDRSRDPLLALCVIEALIGVSAVLSLPIFGRFFYTLERVFPSFGVISWLPNTNSFIKAFLVMFFPSFLMGAAFPLVVTICARSAGRLGQSVGKIYSANTLGCILGSFAAAFVLIPLLGIGKSILLLGCVNVGMGVILFYAHPGVAGDRKRLVSVGVAPLLLLLGVGVARFAHVQFTSPLEDVGEVLYYKEGVGATVKVFKNRTNGIREISIDGYPVACSGNRLNMRGPEIQKALAHFPMLLHPEPKDVCIVGFGAGGTSYNVSLYDVRSVVCAELSQEVPKAASHLEEVNHGVLNNPRFHLVIEDGRNYLLRTDRTFDVITVDATSPKFAGNVSLYTKEFYDLCKARLNPSGVLALWAPYHLLSRREDLLLFRTFRESYPHFSVWFTSGRGYFVLIGSDRPIAVDFKRLERRMSAPEIQRELLEVGINSPYRFLSCFVMGEDVPESYFAGIPLNTDNHPLIEYFRDDGAGLGELIFDGRVGHLPVYNFGETLDEAVTNARRYERYMKATDYIISSHYWQQRSLGEAIERARLALAVDPGNLEAIALKAGLEDKYRKLFWAKAEDAQKRKDLRGALQACYSILEVIPDDRTTLSMINSLYEDMGASGPARFRYEQTVTITPASAPAFVN